MSDTKQSTAKFSLSTALLESLRYAFGRAGHVLRITWPALVAMFVLLAVQIALTPIFPVNLVEIAQNRELVWRYLILTVGFFLAFMLIQLAFFIIVARDYYLKERPASIFPVFGPVVFRTIIMLLLALGAAAVTLFPAGLIGSMALQDPNTASRVLGIVAYLVGVLSCYYIICRWITWLVSQAVGRPQKLGEAWNATWNASLKILAGLLILFALTFAIIIPIGLASDFALQAIGQKPAPGQITVSAFVLSIIHLVLSQLVMASYTVYAANVFRQTEGLRVNLDP